MNFKKSSFLLLLLFFFTISFISLSHKLISQENSLEKEQTVEDSLRPDSSDTTMVLPDTVKYLLDRTIPNSAFQVGEKLTFTVRYGFIKAGEATMAVENIVPVGDRTAYKLVSTAQSASTFDIFFKVRDRVESWMDTGGIFSWQFIKMLREGSYKYDLLVDYYQYYGKADVQSIRYHDEEPLRVKESNTFQLEIPPYVLDILASFYYVRTQNLRIGMPLYMTNHDNKKIYDLKVIVQKREILDVKAGKFRCIMVQPVLRGEALFKQKGELWIWLTDDQYKIPVQMKSAVFIGSITTELTKIEGITLPLPSQIQD
ncbi:MAG: DUF3108 domain-containing protein [Calditrichaeota bacterium]|nr:DUF3108 domain-containing protein [Calditrichota bacterium]